VGKMNIPLFCPSRKNPSLLQKKSIIATLPWKKISDAHGSHQCNAVLSVHVSQFISTICAGNSLRTKSVLHEVYDGVDYG